MKWNSSKKSLAKSWIICVRLAFLLIESALNQSHHCNRPCKFHPFRDCQKYHTSIFQVHRYLLRARSLQRQTCSFACSAYNHHSAIVATKNYNWYECKLFSNIDGMRSIAFITYRGQGTITFICCSIQCCRIIDSRNFAIEVFQFILWKNAIA